MYRGCVSRMFMDSTYTMVEFEISHISPSEIALFFILVWGSGGLADLTTRKCAQRHLPAF